MTRTVTLRSPRRQVHKLMFISLSLFTFPFINIQDLHDIKHGVILKLDEGGSKVYHILHQRMKVQANEFRRLYSGTLNRQRNRGNADEVENPRVEHLCCFV